MVFSLSNLAIDGFGRWAFAVGDMHGKAILEPVTHKSQERSRVDWLAATGRQVSEHSPWNGVPSSNLAYFRLGVLEIANNLCIKPGAAREHIPRNRLD